MLIPTMPRLAGAVLATQETPDIMAIRLGPDFCGIGSGGGGHGARLDLGGSRSRFIRPAMCSDRRRSPSSIAGCASWRRATKAAGRPDLRGLRAARLRCLHHRGDLRAAGSAIRHRTPRRSAARLAGAVSRPGASSEPMRRQAQRLIRLLRLAGYDARSISMAPWIRVCDRAQGVDLGPLEPASEQRGPRWRDRALARLRPLPGPLDPTLRRSADRSFASGWMQVRSRPPARRRTAARPVGPLRLAEPTATWPRSRPPRSG